MATPSDGQSMAPGTNSSLLARGCTALHDEGSVQPRAGMARATLDRDNQAIHRYATLNSAKSYASG